MQKSKDERKIILVKVEADIHTRLKLDCVRKMSNMTEKVTELIKAYLTKAKA